MIIRNRTTNGLKGQYLIAQGNVLGTGRTSRRPSTQGVALG